jgi:microcystin-dependent protein
MRVIIMKNLRKLWLVPTLAVTYIGSGGATPANACPSDPFISSVCIMAANFCPRGYAEANGQLLSISQNTALFSLLGTMYGGDGRTSFGLPDLRSRSPVHVGAGPGLSTISQGQRGGVETVTQSAAQLASHGHAAATSADLRGKGGGGNSGDSADLTGRVLAGRNNSKIYGPGPADATMDAGSIVAATTVAPAGGSQAQQNRSPFLGLRYCIALVGLYPSRN